MDLLPGSIVVPLDGSKNSESALAYAVLARQVFQGPLQLVRVRVAEAETLAESEPGRPTDTVTAYLDEVAARPGLSGAERRVLEGYPPDAILDAAADAGVIVLASHGRPGLHSVFIGSVADKVVRGAQVPVLLVPGEEGHGPPGKRPVLVGVDGSQAAEQALELGRRFATALEAPLTVVRAWTIPTIYGGIYYPPEVLDQAGDEAEEYLKQVARPGEQTVVICDAPALALRKEAERADVGLVAVGSHGETLTRRIFLGSTTDRLMHSLGRPLLIVP